MKQVKKKKLGRQLLKTRIATSEAERVATMAAMGFTVRQIAIELGQTEEFVKSNYTKEINEGPIRAGAIARMIVHAKAMQGDHDCLSYECWTLNHERLDPLPDLVKDLIADQKARSQPANAQAIQKPKRPRDARGRFKWEY